MTFYWQKLRAMRLLKSDSFLVLFFMMCSFQSLSQKAITFVVIKKISNSLYKVQYQLHPTADYDVEKIVLKIWRRREGKTEEIFSKDITSTNPKPQGRQVNSYSWMPAKEVVKTGDELQAKIVLLYQTSLAKQKLRLSNKTPHADAGNFLEAVLPVKKPIELNGSKSHDEDGKIVSVLWKQIAGPSSIIILKKDSLIAYASGGFKEGNYAFELFIKDDKGATAISRTILSVKPAPLITNTFPVASVPKKDTAGGSLLPEPKQKNSTRLKGGPSNALVNLLLPGAGHYLVSGDYNGNNRRTGSFIVTGIYAASIGGAVYFNGKANSQNKKYKELAAYREYQNDANGLITGVRGANEAEANKYFNRAKSSYRNSLISLGVSGSILAGDLIYTLLKGNRNKKEWKKETTSFRPKLFISSNGYVTTAGLQIKF